MEASRVFVSLKFTFFQIFFFVFFALLYRFHSTPCIEEIFFMTDNSTLFIFWEIIGQKWLKVEMDLLFLQCFPVFKERNRKKNQFTDPNIFHLCCLEKKQNLRLYNNNHHHCNAEQNVNWILVPILFEYFQSIY